MCVHYINKENFIIAFVLFQTLAMSIVFGFNVHTKDVRRQSVHVGGNTAGTCLVRLFVYSSNASALIPSHQTARIVLEHKEVCTQSRPQVRRNTKVKPRQDCDIV